MLEKQFNPDILYNKIVHYYIDKKNTQKTKQIKLLSQLYKKKRKEESVKIKIANIFPIIISEIQKHV